MHKRLINYQFYNSLCLVKINNSVRKKLWIRQKKETGNISRAFLKLPTGGVRKTLRAYNICVKYWYIQIQM